MPAVIHLRNAWLGLRQDGLVISVDRAWDFVRRRLPWRPRHRLVNASPVLPHVLRCDEAPLVSIVVPVYNNFACTAACLASIADNCAAIRHEIIVVDDASTDGTGKALAGLSGLRYLHNEENAGFIESCNRGAALARGEYLVLLNNDTIVQPGWLEGLLDTFTTFPDTGLAGSKLLYPDGRLQEAGGILFADGRAGNYGRFDAALDPRYCCVREVDYCSGASIAVPTALFAELGGFDTVFRPAYYEDADLAMRIRQRELKVRYQPASLVVHVEGASSGVSEESGAKAFQRPNREKFRHRWAMQLSSGYPRWGMQQDMAVARRKRALIIVADADLLRGDASTDAQSLMHRGYDVSILIEHGCLESSVVDRLQASGIEVWSRQWSGMQRGWVRRHGRRFSTIIVLDTASCGRYRRWFARWAPGAIVLGAGDVVG